MILFAAALAAATPPAPPPPRGFVAVIRSRVVGIIRAPFRSAPPAVIERKGPRCIPADAIAGAAVVSPVDVDLALHGGERMRAKLDDDCPALDFYRGFYVSPAADGQICAGRDAIRTRSGGECGIDRFHRIVPAVP